MAVAFDTLAFHERLRAGGFSEQQAKAATEAFARATAQEPATKADLERVETVLRVEIENLRTELRAEIENSRTEFRGDIDGVRTEFKGELQALEQRLLTRLTESRITFIKWLVPLLIGQTALLAAVVKLL